MYNNQVSKSYLASQFSNHFQLLYATYMPVIEASRTRLVKIDFPSRDTGRKFIVRATNTDCGSVAMATIIAYRVHDMIRGKTIFL